MAHFAELDKNKVVLRVVVVPDDQEHRGNDYLNELGLTGTWIQTSYNATIRGKYAGVGDIYDEVKDEFYTVVVPKVEPLENDIS